MNVLSLFDGLSGGSACPTKGTNARTYIEKCKRQIVWTTSDESARISGTSPKNFRKLTPTECERLQTVPEGHTDHVSNTRRYMMLGNGFTVDVVAHILKECVFDDD